MKEFTFATITYNHSEYIIEHLESLKLVVLTYGDKCLNNLIISDDASTDSTVALAQKWIDTNRDLFNDVKIIVSEKNKGIVKNYTQALLNIKTNKFKIIAGDDLYLCEDIYSISQLSDMVLTPLINFSDYNVINNEKIFIDKEMIYYRNKDFKKIIQDKLKYNMYISSPGAMWDLSYADQGLYETLADYKWIEDVPLYSYLINKSDVKVWFCETPVVAYRSNVGISRNKNHERARQYDEELENIRKKIYSHKKSRIKFLNPYVYKLFVNRLYIKYLKSNDINIQNFEKSYSQAQLKAQKTIDTIVENVIKWKKDNLEIN